MIVDGQQRLTSLYAVLKAKEVVTEDNELQQMRISFNPFTEEFAVADAARANDPEWLTSISDIWNSPKGEFGFISGFIKELREARGLTDEEEQLVGERLGHLAGLKNYQFSALELSADLDIDDVAEVFVRINSAGHRPEQRRLHPHAHVGACEGGSPPARGLRPRGEDSLDQGRVAVQPLPCTVARPVAPGRCRARTEAWRAPERVPGTARP